MPQYKKLTRGKGTGEIKFGSEVEEQLSAQVQKDMEADIGELLTPSERFARIEERLARIESQIADEGESG
jgi:hypothetical protein